MSQPTVAIVILNYNGKTFLEQFLPAIIASTYSNKRVIVADNASTDDSASFLRQYFPSVEIVINDKNYGFAGGYNRALKQIEAEYYVLLNSDVEVTPGWIEPVIELMQSDENIAACQPKLLSWREKDHFEYAGAAGGWIDSLAYPFAKGRIFEVCEIDIHQYDQAGKIFWASGAVLFIRSKIFHDVGGFDEYFFAHQEEIDLCWRIHRAGYSVYYCPGSMVYHVGGGTLPKGYRKTFLNFRNNMLMLIKNMPVAEKIWKVPLRLWMDWIFAFKCIFSGDFDSIVAVAKAHWSVFTWLFKRKQRVNLPKKRTESIPGVYKGSIVWVYFVDKKKRFREIVEV